MPFLFSKRFITALLIALFAAIGVRADGVRLKKVVIDAGHGGHDAGCISPDKKIKEKTVALDVALQLGDKIKKAYPNVKVIYTRDKDVFIPLDKRADIANKNHADLFISIHCNSVDNSKPNGSETWIMGMNHNKANMEVCKRENSVILLEDDYATKYQGFDPNDTESYIFFNLMQNAYMEQSLIFAEKCQQQMRKGPVKHDRGIKQAGFMVLWRSTMPSVLVEIGFLSNPEDRAILADKEKRGMIAEDLFKAFRDFKKQYEVGNKSEEEKPEQEPESEPEEEQLAEPVEQPATEPAAESEKATGDGENIAAGGNFYAVQIFALSKELQSGAPQFKGEKDIHRFKVGNVFKYTAGTFETEQEAAGHARKLSEKFPGCFVVKIDNFEIKKK